MATSDKNAPVFHELLGKDWRGIEDGECDGASRLRHKTQLLRSAGQMVAGTTMPVPSDVPARDVTSVQAMAAALTVIGEPSAPSESMLPKAAVGIAGAVAFTSAAALASLLGQGNAQGTRPPLGTPVQLMAISQAPVASMAPVAASRPEAAPFIVRIAQKDASALEASNVFGPAGKPVRIPVVLRGAKAEDYSFLMFRGLPPKATLSAGFRLKESWAVSLRDLDNLMLETPDDFEGSFNLEILLVKGRDTPAESRVITVEIVPADIQLPPTAGFAVQQPAAPGPQVLTAAPRTPDAERPVQVQPKRQAAAPANAAPRSRLTIPAADEQVMMLRAEAFMRSNDIASARLLFEHLAKSGSARGALAMAKTYDPTFFRNIEAAGLKPDIAKARTWYSQAADLGDQEAPGRLSALASR